MDPVIVQVCVLGSKISQELFTLVDCPSYPPAARIFPLDSLIIWKSSRLADMSATFVHNSVLGSYTSEEASPYPGRSRPPATRTFPFSSSVLRCSKRPSLRLPVTTKVLDSGSYNSDS